MADAGMHEREACVLVLGREDESRRHTFACRALIPGENEVAPAAVCSSSRRRGWTPNLAFFDPRRETIPDEIQPDIVLK